ncbi:thiopeptide-type bacteriocin biosynthesis protein [Flagellimonas flava]|uniref:Thiopeptide-type bacteriocin biosynthesis domain-containing protein n=1 Tax=Flagellimonas flava TaxID=570519 RepID=A0A1M5LZS9_9FLAO|nr:thiopeptide-type bacteriocin biosynthesis protein [Allomuricauda flava]SHG70496.1 thiopeptide-type bacteriocin biosynthesis domain-containing protein [Allomuricauda flava]
MNNIKVDRNLIPGDEWLYYKVYAGPKTSDSILTDIIKPVTEKLLEEKIIKSWFFIRYTDPKHHLRLRFQVFDLKNIGEVINRLYPYFKQLMNEDLIWKTQIETYQRELERYGDNTMELSEEIFFHDSVCIVNFLDMIEGDEGEELRWLFSLRAMDRFLDTFAYSLEEKLSLLDRLKTGFGIEFGISRPLKKQLDDKYRAESKKIERFMRLKNEDKSTFYPILEILDQREFRIQPLALRINGHKKRDGLKVRYNDLMASYLHMFMNRLFKSKNRLHELVCYDFLYRYYKSVVARKKYKKPNTSAKMVAHKMGVVKGN